MPNSVLIARVALLLVFVVLPGCLTKAKYRSAETRGYTIDKEYEKNVGDVILQRDRGQQVQYSVWMGIFAGSWEETPWSYAAGAIREELIYSGGRSGAIKIVYREFRVTQDPPPPVAETLHLFRPSQMFAAPAFYQELEYDLGESKDITFRGYGIEILSADNKSIRYRIVRE